MLQRCSLLVNASALQHQSPYCLRPGADAAAGLIAVRYKAPRFKPKMARTRPLKTPTMLALDHFDFYYAPLFAKRWPSMRLGLLTPNKFVAVLNRFSKSADVNARILEELGTLDLVETLTKGKETASERLERMRRQAAEELKEIKAEELALEVGCDGD